MLVKMVLHSVESWRRHRRCASTVGAALLAIGSLTACVKTHFPAVAANSGAAPAAQCAGTGTAYTRTELFFGKSVPGGGTVTDAAFAQFLDREVTLRFPAGFTVVSAMGQYRETNGVIDHEASAMLILLNPRASASDASKKIDEIRTAYDKTFHQESVLREDEQSTCVSW
jgi:hypothetical protein